MDAIRIPATISTDGQAPGAGSRILWESVAAAELLAETDPKEASRASRAPMAQFRR